MKRGIPGAGRVVVSCLALAALASCGGGGDEPAVTAQAGDDRKAAQAFVPPTTIPADANVNGMWSPAYKWPLISVHSAILPDGRLLTYGSDLTGLQTGHANYDIWDTTGAPDAGHNTLPNTTGTDIFCSSQLLLPGSGNVFIAGGDNWTGTGTTNGPNNNSNLLDTGTNTLARGNNMTSPRWYSSSITLTNGETYIQGGSGGGSRPEIRAADGTFRTMSGIDTSTVASSFPRIFVAPDGRVVGYDYDSGRLYRIDPTGATGSIAFGGTFNTATSGGWTSTAAMYRPGRILQFGGNSNGAYTIDITGATPVVTATQSMAKTRQWSNATILADGRVAATSGTVVAENASQPTNNVEIWNPTTAQWSQGPAAQKIRMYHSNAILLPDASVLVSGGGAGSPTLSTDPNQNNLSAEVYYPSYLFAAGGVRAARPTITTAPTVVDIGRTYGVDVAGAASVSRVTLVKTGSMSHSFNFEQRFLDLAFTTSGGHVTIQAPTRAGEAPPGFYMLFVFNEAGVPSVASIVRMNVASVANPAITPVLGNPGDQTTTTGSAVDLALVASDPNGDVLAYAATGLPPGLAIDAATGHITGAATTNGSYTVVVTATDGVNTASQSFAWTVQGPQSLSIATPAPAPFVVTNGTATYTASAAGTGTVMYQWNFGDGSATTAWSTSPTVTHAYAAAGTYSVTITVTDDTGTVQSRSFTQAVYLPTTANAPRASGNVLVETPASGNPRLWVVNQDNDSVSVFDTVTLARLGEVAVGSAPRTLAVAADGSIWVTNKRSASISVINPATRAVTQTIALPRGSQPFGIVMSPTSAVAYVALEAGGSVLKFNTSTFAQSGSVAVGLNARHLSVSADGANLYVSRFVTPPLPGEGTATVTTGAANGGEVLQVNAATLAVARTIVLQHSEKPDTENSARGIPNYLGAAVISPDGTQAYVPGKQDNIKRGVLRDGNGLNFQNTVRAISSRIDLAANAETLAARIDHDNASMASAAAFDPRGVYLFVALETSREVAVVNAFSRAQLFRIDVGRAPQGLAVSPGGTRLYVNNFMDRSVGVYDLRPLLTQGQYSLPLIATLGAVATEKLAADVLVGKQLFYDARDTRLARDRYMSCAACHNDGGHDGRVWDLTGFGEGLRNTINLRGRAGMGHGFLHWSNNFDEVQDFEGQIRALAGGTGLMPDAAFNAGTRSQPLGDRKAGLSTDLDALAAYVGSLASFEPAPARPGAATLSAAATSGKAIFAARNCGSCHAGTAFSGSGANTLVNVGTLKPASGQRLGAPLAGIDVPTLRDVWATAPYLHDGSAATLELAVRAHGGVTIGDADLANLTQYLREIGSDEPAPAVPAGPGAGLTGAYFNNVGLTGSPVFIRNEAVDVDWGTGAPGTGVAADNFSVRWSGSVVAPATGSYRFQTASDDGVRLWVNGALVIDNWTDHAPTDDTSATVNLVAGQAVAIVAEYYERGGGATMRLRWQTPGEAGFVAIPADRLVPAQPAGAGLVGTYFNNTTLSGAPVLTRTEAVNFSWGSGSPGPGVNGNSFSARWTGTLLPSATGTYRIQTLSDDGIRVWVNGTQVINSWTTRLFGAATTTSGAIVLTAGQKATIRVEYYESSGTATMQLRWQTPGATSYVAIPAASLFAN